MQICIQLAALNPCLSNVALPENNQRALVVYLDTVLQTSRPGSPQLHRPLELIRYSLDHFRLLDSRSLLRLRRDVHSRLHQQPYPRCHSLGLRLSLVQTDQ